MSPLEILFVIALAPVVVAALGFWLWMLVDCLKYPGRTDLDRLTWVIVIVGLKFVGAAIYFFVKFRSRDQGQGQESGGPPVVAS